MCKHLETNKDETLRVESGTQLSQSSEPAQTHPGERGCQLPTDTAHRSPHRPTQKQPGDTGSRGMTATGKERTATTNPPRQELVDKVDKIDKVDTVKTRMKFWKEKEKLQRAHIK